MAATTIFNTTLILSPPMVALLRLLPLLSSTASMTHAYMELVTMSSFYRTPPTRSFIAKYILGPVGLAPASPTTTSATTAEAQANRERQLMEEVEKANDVAIPRWFSTWFNTAVVSVVVLNNITTFATLANLYLFPDGLGDARKYYMWGLGAAVGHFAFVPGVAGSVEKLLQMHLDRERGEGEDGRKGMEKGRAARAARKWVSVHRVRMATVDAMAWVCFGVGALAVLSRGL